LPLQAVVSHGTCIRVIAGESFVVGYEGALTRFRVTYRLQADGRVPFRVGAGDNRVRVDCAQVGQLVLVAYQRTVADIPVFKQQAIAVLGTLAVHLESGASPPVADIVHRAGVCVVAQFLVELRGAASEAVTQVISTDIAVVADHGEADALAFLTMVSDSAGIAVLALPFAQIVVRAAILSQAGISGALVSVVAKIDEVPADFQRLIGSAIAVVIQSVAALLQGFIRVTLRQPFVRADPLALACARFVGNLAGGPESQRHGLARAGANSCVSHTLCRADSVHGFGLVTREPPGALVIVLAKSTAETAFHPVAHADIIRAHALAIRCVLAGLAEIGMAGDTHVHQVRIRTRDLAAFPTRWALLGAGDRTESLPHVLHAPSGLTLGVFLAFVEKAAGPGLTLWKGSSVINDVRRKPGNLGFFPDLGRVCGKLIGTRQVRNRPGLTSILRQRSDLIKEPQTGIGTACEQAQDGNSGVNAHVHLLLLRVSVAGPRPHRTMPCP